LVSRPRNSTKHTREDLRDYLDDETIDALTTFGECSEKDITKVMRLGSLDRIIASSVVARRSSNDVLLQKQASIIPIDHDENIKKIVERILKALTNNDMNGLAKLIADDFDDACVISTPDLMEPVMRKSRIMMYFGLLFETFPDGLWKFQGRSYSRNSVMVGYSFSGTSVFDQSIDDLFKYVNLQVMKRIDNSEDKADIEDCEFVLSHMPDCMRIPTTCALSPQLTYKRSFEHIVQADMPPLKLAINDPAAFSNAGTSHDRGSCSENDVSNDDGMIHVNSLSTVRISSVKATNPASGTQLTRTSSRSNSVTSVLTGNPSIRALVTKALKQGSFKVQRRMEIAFNDMDQVVRMVIS
jgi:hypothetical protein